MKARKVILQELAWAQLSPNPKALETYALVERSFGLGLPKDYALALALFFILERCLFLVHQRSQNGLQTK